MFGFSFAQLAKQLFIWFDRATGLDFGALVLQSFVQHIPFNSLQMNMTTLPVLFLQKKLFQSKFFFVGLPKEDIFFWTLSKSCISIISTHYNYKFPFRPSEGS